MSLTNIAEGCVLNKEDIGKACDRMKDMKKCLSQAKLRGMGADEFYFGLQKKLAQFDEITPAEFVAAAIDVINTLRSDAKEISVTYANKYEGLEQKIGALAMSIFPNKFYEEVLFVSLD